MKPEINAKNGFRTNMITNTKEKTKLINRTFTNSHEKTQRLDI